MYFFFLYRSIIYDLSIYMLQLLFQCSVCTPTLRVLLLLFMSCCENFPKVSPRDDFFAVKVFAASILKVWSPYKSWLEGRCYYS